MLYKFPRRWDTETCTSFLQRVVIIHSILYYELDNPLISDKSYDEVSKQLLEYQKDANIDATQYGYMMYDFDGNTGFDLYTRLNDSDRKYLRHIASRLAGVKTKKKKKGKLF